MEPRIEQLKEKRLIGLRMSINLAQYNIGELWKRFMPRRNEIQNSISNDLISLAVYGDSYFTDFNPTNQFERWAAVEVSNLDDVPPGMETYILSEGLYAVFDYKGLTTDRSIFQYIYATWLPNSKFELDHRAHFEVLGKNYRNNDPTSEEEIWIPIKIMM